MTHIRISDAFFGLLKDKQKRGESMERVIINNMDKELKKIFDDQDARKRKKLKGKKTN